MSIDADRRAFWRAGMKSCLRCGAAVTGERVVDGCRMDGDAYGSESFRCACGWSVSFLFDDRCEGETPYFFETRFWRDELVVPEGMFVLSGTPGRQLVPDVPFPEDDLYDRDALGSALRVIETSPARVLFAWPRMALMWTTIANGTVVAVEQLQGVDAVRTWIEHGLRLPPELRAKIDAHLRPGQPVEDALTAVFGPHRRLLTPMADGHRKAFVVRCDHPMRSAVLDVEVDATGAIASVGVVEGRAAWDRLQTRPRLA